MIEWLQALIEWIETFARQHPALVTGLLIGSVLMFVSGLLAAPWLIVRMPADYFLHLEHPRPYRHPLLHAALVISRNVIGAVLLLLGIAMLVLPGQGILTILVALALLDLPGKHRLELALVRRYPVRRSIDWLRARAGRAPIRLPGDVPDATTTPGPRPQRE